MEFIREQIKDKPINKKRLFLRLGISALSGLVFALTAGLVFLFITPRITPKVEDTQQKEPELEVVTQSTEEETEKQEKPNVAIPDVSLTISDYQELQNELYSIGNAANKSIVTVTGVVSETDWMNNAYETEGQGSGVILSEDNNYLYILTEKKVISDATHIRVSFIDESSADATMLKYDGNTGIAILTVEKRQLEKATKNAIAIATVGSSYTISKGTIVIALGSPLGTNYSILTGNITSTNNEIVTLDQNYSVFTTDIVASEKGSGILINTKGEIVGMVVQAYSGSQDMSTLTALAITEISGLIENLMNGKDTPYVGLYVSTVGDKISKTYDIPKGVFITKVATDSPAMNAGLQSGDVITHINGVAIQTDVLYSNKIRQLIPGTTCEMTVKRQTGNGYHELKFEVEIGVLE